MIKNVKIQKLIRKYLLNTSYVCPYFFYEPTHPMLNTSKETSK